MKVSRLNVNISADAFVATTLMEFEFCNPNNKEIEGLYRFSLQPGQVITAFQLELNGKYREGTIEEKWKARNAYSSIVGKRVDPALLIMEQPNHYRLNIYPVPASGCRKVTITIQQLLREDNDAAQYALPLRLADTVGVFQLNIHVKNNEVKPCAGTGVIDGNDFVQKGKQFEMNWKKEKLFVDDLLKFCVPLSTSKKVCAAQYASQSFFAMWLKPDVPSEYNIVPKKLTVFWDASASAENRSIKKEINFLRQFISYHRVAELRIIPFNDVTLDTVIFNRPYQSNNKGTQYLQNLSYDGATQLGCIKVSDRSELVMIFTDGNNTYGNRKPKTDNALTYWVHASTSVDQHSFANLVGSRGGREIDLNNLSVNDAIQLSSKASNWLLDIRSANGPTTIEQQLPIELGKVLFIGGRFPGKSDTLYFQYGNYQGITKVEQVILEPNGECDTNLNRLPMLDGFDKIIETGNWENALDFGLRENIVTQNTSFIVLERIEDYIKYNISPPKDLEEECRRLNYVKQDRRKDRVRLNQQDEYSILSKVVESYNFRLRSWDPSAEWATLNAGDITGYFGDVINGIQPDAGGSDGTNSLTGKVQGLMIRGANNMDEVIVVGYGSTMRRNMTGSVAIVNRQELSSYQTIEQALAGRVPGVTVTPTGDAWRPNMSTIQIRGAVSLVGTGAPLYVLDGIPVSNNINDIININDIESITILKDIQASAIYGSRAANGVIIVTSKKGNRYNYRSYSTGVYRLSDMDDIEYLQEIKSVGVKEKSLVYERLRQEHLKEPGFYLDMAQHFFESGLKDQAVIILKNAAEVGNGSIAILRAIGFILESWGNFEDAILVHQQLVEDLPLSLSSRRDLALAHYQHGDIQKSVDIFYDALRMFGDTDLNLKTSMLNELNAIISIHRKELNLSAIPNSIIRPMPVDLRIVVDGNKENLSYVEIKEPGGQSCTIGNKTKNGGILYSDYQFSYNRWFADYSNKDLEPGHYRIVVNYYDSYSYSGKIPSVLRIITFRNFGKKNQSIKITNVMMDNQAGEMEIADFKF